MTRALCALLLLWVWGGCAEVMPTSLLAGDGGDVSAADGGDLSGDGDQVTTQRATPMDGDWRVVAEELGDVVCVTITEGSVTACDHNCDGSEDVVFGTTQFVMDDQSVTLKWQFETSSTSYRRQELALTPQADGAYVGSGTYLVIARRAGRLEGAPLTAAVVMTPRE
jgi:hypothetical protein